MIERDFNITVTLDGASNYGCPLFDRNGNQLRYCSRYNDGKNSYRNFLSLRFDQMRGEVIWLFCPKTQESKFLSYYLNFEKRPSLLFLLMQHNEGDNLLPLLHKKQSQYRVYKNLGYLSKAVKNHRAREKYNFHGLIHIFLLPSTF